MKKATDQEILHAAQDKLLHMREERKAMGPHGPHPVCTGLNEIIENCKLKAEEHYKNGLNMVPGKAEQKEESRSIPTLAQCGVDKRYQTSRFENFRGGAKLVAELKRLTLAGQSVLLTGNTGCGKTHLAVAMMVEYLKNGGCDALFITLPDLLLEIRSSFYEKTIATEKELVDLYSSREFMILDDLGAEKPTEYTVATLSLILDRRIRQERQTIITTNLTVEAIGEYSGVRIASRISAMESIKVNMPDYRKMRNRGG